MYKRQHPYPSLFIKDSFIHQKVKSFSYRRGIDIIVQGNLRGGWNLPVSYTHLDVYKIQEWKAALWASQQQDAFPILFLILEGFLVSSFLFREVQKVFFHEQGLPVF